MDRRIALIVMPLLLLMSAEALAVTPPKAEVGEMNPEVNCLSIKALDEGIVIENNCNGSFIIYNKSIKRDVVLPKSTREVEPGEKRKFKGYYFVDEDSREGEMKGMIGGEMISVAVSMETIRGGEDYTALFLLVISLPLLIIGSFGLWKGSQERKRLLEIILATGILFLVLSFLTYLLSIIS